MGLFTNIIGLPSSIKRQKVWDDARSSLLTNLRHVDTPWVLWTSRSECWKVRDENGLNQWLDTLMGHIDCVAVRTYVLPQSNLWNGIINAQMHPILWRTNTLIEYLQSKTNFLPFSNFAVDDFTFQSFCNQGIEAIDANCFGFHMSVRNIGPTPEERTLVSQVLVSRDKRNLTSDKRPQVTIILAAFNEECHIGWAIRSVMAQTLPNWELIIINDGSIDGTAAKAGAFDDPRIRIYHNPINLGKARSLNIALEHVQSPFILELDADDWLPPHALAVLTRTMQLKTADTAILTAYYYLWREKKDCSIHYLGIRFYTPFAVTPTCAIPPIPRFYRTGALRSVNGWPVFSEKYGRLFEDIAICTRLGTQFKMAHVPEPLYHRVIRPDSISQVNQNLYTAWYQNRNP